MKTRAFGCPFRFAPARALFFSALLLSAAVDFRAAESAWIAGHVVDNSSGQMLRGAVIRIEGTTIEATSDLQGEFLLNDVPPGHHLLHVSYIGLPDLNYPVETTAGQHLTVALGLGTELVRMAAFTVQSFREGQAKALNQQKSSDTVINVVGSDNIGRFPDPNAAEALQRVVGISLELDTGEGRYVNVRGVSSEYNSVTADGQPMLSNIPGSRTVNLNVIPANQISQIEVVKSKTPDMIADGIGGSINIVNKSALDSDRRVISGAISGGEIAYTHAKIFDASLAAGQPFGPQKQFGLLLSGGYSRVPRGFDDIEQDYDTKPISGTPGLVSTKYDLRGYLNVLTHRSVSLSLDARPDANDRYYLRSSFNRYDDDRRRRQFLTTFSNGTYTRGTNPGDILVANTRVQAGLQDELTIQELGNIGAGGKNLLGTSTLDYAVALGYGRQRIPYNNTTTFLRTTGINEYYNRTDYNFPTYGVTNGANVYDPALQPLNRITNNRPSSTDRQFSTETNLKVPANLGERKGYAKFGLRFSDRTKSNFEIDSSLTPRGTPVANVTLAQLAEYDDPPFLYRPRWHLGPQPDVNLTRAFIASNSSLFVTTSKDSAYYHANEKVFAAYGLYSVDIDRLHVLGGVRAESTRTGLAYFNFLPSGAEIPVAPHHDYTNFFPSLHLRYNASKELVLRANVATSIARPNFTDEVGSRTINETDKIITGGNPQLRPTYSRDVDVTAEYYLPSLGILSAGGFYKDIKDYTFRRLTVLHGGEFDGYQFTGPSNIPSSHLTGLELGYNQQFNFLPGGLAGFGLYANATVIASRAEIRPGEISHLPKQAGQIQNLALFYEKYGATARLALTHTGSFLYKVGDTATGAGTADIYYSRNTQLDFTASYALSRRFTVYGDVLNLTNRPLRFFEGNTVLPIQQEHYDLRLDAGVKFIF